MRVIFIFLALFFISCGSKPLILGQDDSQGFAWNSSFAPDLALAPDMLASKEPLLGAGMFFESDGFSSAGFDTIDTPPISLVSLDSGMPLIVDLNGPERTFNWLVSEIRHYQPEYDKKIAQGDLYKHLPFLYIQLVSTTNRAKCLAVDESGFMVLKDCFDDLKSGKYETVFQFMATTTEAVQIRSLLLAANECLGTFVNPQIEAWQRVGLRKCALGTFDTASVVVLWAIAPQIRPAAQLGGF